MLKNLAFTACLVCLSGCEFSAEGHLAVCVNEAEKLLSLPPRLSWREADPQTGRSLAEVDRIASETGMTRESYLIRSCMRARGFEYDASAGGGDLQAKYWSRDWTKIF